MLLANLTHDLAVRPPSGTSGSASGTGPDSGLGGGSTEASSGGAEDDALLALLAPVLTGDDALRLAQRMTALMPSVVPMRGELGLLEGLDSDVCPVAAVGGGVAEGRPGGWVLHDMRLAVRPMAVLRERCAALAATGACVPPQPAAGGGPDAGDGRGAGDGSGSRAAGAGAAGARRCASCGCLPDTAAGVKLSTCSGCRAVAYCSTGCQHAHWKAGHRRECRRAARK